MTEVVLQQVEEGDQLPTLTKKPVSRVQLAQYAGASGDLNPLHLDDDFAKKVGLDGAIAHGMLIMGFLGEYVMQIASKQAKVVNFKMRFGKMTFLGDEITCAGTVKEVFELKGTQHIELELSAIKHSGEVVGTGNATLQLAK